MERSTTQERFKRGAADAGRFFKYIAGFVGFTDDDAATIRETRFIIEKYIPSIVADFYAQLLKFPATRGLFLKKDGSIDREYLEMRMQHQANFWRRAASGEYDDDFARFVDYVGRSHTSHGADPNIYVPERYVIGMIAFVQQRIGEALHKELHEIDDDETLRATQAWNAFLMVVLEMLSRSYDREIPEEKFDSNVPVNKTAIRQMAVSTYERALGIARVIDVKEVRVADAGEIPDGKRKIVEVDGVSIGVFHHNGEWVALHNSCLHRGGPVCRGELAADTLTCPWHGYQYDVRDGHLLLDPAAHLDRYPVILRPDGIYLEVRTYVRDEPAIDLAGPQLSTEVAVEQPQLADNEFSLADLEPGEIFLVQVGGEPVAVYNVAGSFFATHDRCTHAGGPLSLGHLDGHQVICPWHASCFDVRSGQATCGPAEKPVQSYRVELDGQTGRVLAAVN